MEIGTKGVQDTCNELGLLHASESVKCKMNDGRIVDRILSHVTDIPAFLHAVSQGEKVSEAIVVSGDGGEGKQLITATVIYEGQSEDDEDEEFAHIYVLAMIDGCDENSHNYELMLKKLGFPLETGRIHSESFSHSESFKVIQESSESTSD